MLNHFWAAMVLLAAAVGAFKICILGEADLINTLTDTLFSSAKTGFEMAFGLVAAMALWLGLFQIAEAAGVIRVIARWLTPVLHQLMPEVPPGHPAFGSIGMNVAMGMLGIDNGALPSALKAMQELETLNPHPGRATAAQQMFMVYMTASMTIFPVSILGYRLQAGSAHAADVFVPLLLASYIGLFAGLMSLAISQRLRWRDPVLLGGAGLLVAALGGVAWLVGQWPVQEIAPRVARWGNGALFCSAVAFVLIGWWRKVPVFDCFVEGSAKGFRIAVDLIPYVLGMLVAIGLLRASGVFGLIEAALTALVQGVGLDAAWVGSLPQGLMKSFSSSGARAFMLDTFKTVGPDSFLGHLSAIVQGASDTTFYVIAVCAGAARLQHLGRVVQASLLADVASYAAAVALAYLFFG